MGISSISYRGTERSVKVKETQDVIVCNISPMVDALGVPLVSVRKTI